MAVFSFSKKKSAGWIGVAFASDRIDFVRVEPVGGKPKVTLCRSYRREGDDSQLLARLRKELALDRYRLVALLDKDDYRLAQLDAPNVPAAEMKDVLRWRMRELVDFPIEEASVDVFTIPPAGPGRPAQAVVAIARHPVLRRVIATFESARLELDAIDIPELAVRNVAALFESDARALALLTLGPQGGLLTFSAGGNLYQWRQLDLGLNALATSDDEQRIQLLERLGLELQRSLDNFDRQFSTVGLARLLVAPTPAATGLLAYLQSNLYLPVESAPLAQVADLSAAPELAADAGLATYLPVFGAALRASGGEARREAA